jgi:hypothetical protein
MDVGATLADIAATFPTETCMAVPQRIAGVAVHENINPDLLPGAALRVGQPVIEAWWRRYTGTGH